MFHCENRTNIGPYKSRTAMKAANQYIKRKYKINVSSTKNWQSSV